jgi:hypothetical protein
MTGAQKAPTINGRPMTAKEKAEVKTALTKLPYTAKHKKSLEFSTLLLLEELRLANPTWELNQVLGSILQGYPQETPAALLLDMTKFIIAEWERKEELETV